MSDEGISVALIKPPLSGHNKRGTGSYLNNLYNSLVNFPGLKIELIDYGENKSGFDLVHYPYFDPFFLTLPLLESKPRIVTVHDLIPIKYPQHFPKGIRGFLKWQIQKRVLTLTKLIITDSLASRNDISKIAGVSEEKIKVIPLGVDPQFHKIKDQKKISEFKKKYKLPNNFILYVGDINWNKNIPNLLKAFRKLLQEKAEFRLVLIGNGFTVQSPRLEEILLLVQELGITNNILRLTQISQSDLVLFYNLASIYIQPSIDEGFGLPVLEAFVCGCPVISSAEGSLKEVIGEAAVTINVFDPDDIAGKLNKLIMDKKLQNELIYKGQIQASKFSWEKTAISTFQSYRQALS